MAQVMQLPRKHRSIEANVKDHLTLAMLMNKQRTPADLNAFLFTVQWGKWDKDSTLQQMKDGMHASLWSKYIHDGNEISLSSPWIIDVSVVETEEWDECMDLIHTMLLHRQMVVLLEDHESGNIVPSPRIKLEKAGFTVVRFLI